MDAAGEVADVHLIATSSSVSAVFELDLEFKYEIPGYIELSLNLFLASFQLELRAVSERLGDFRELYSRLGPGHVFLFLELHVFHRNSP